LKVEDRKSASCIVPIAAFAPISSISYCLSALLLITVTACPFCTNPVVSGLPMWPNESVSEIFIFLFFFLQSTAETKNRI